MLDALFLFSAGVGGATVVLRMVLMLFGIGDDHSFGGAHDIGPGDTADSHSDLDAGTRLITIQGVAAFMMMFGLVGLALTREAEALQRGEVARLSAQVEIQKAQAAAEAEARGIRQVLESKAAGYESLVRSAGDARSAATLLMIEKLEEIVAKQVETIQNLKIDKITVWDSGVNGNGHASSTSQFLSSLVTSLPPLQEIAKMAGIELPAYLGRVKSDEGASQDDART